MSGLQGTAMNITDTPLLEASPRLRQVVGTTAVADGEQAILNALEWIRSECASEGVIFCQYRRGQLLNCLTRNVDPRWQELYRGAELHLEDPVLRCLRQNSGFIDWKEAFRTFEPSAFYRAAMSDLGLLPALSYAYAGPTQSATNLDSVQTLCSLTGMQRAANHNDRYLVASLVPVLHLAVHGRRPQARTLTEKELEILRWAKAGKTAWEIGRIRDISEATVKYHFKSIYCKLGVTNRAQAVGEALCMGLIP